MVSRNFSRNNMGPKYDKVLYDAIDPRSERQLDLEPAASGYGHDHYCPEGIPVETALFAILAAAGLSFGALFMAITKITARKRRKRDMDNAFDYVGFNDKMDFYEILTSLAWQGSVSFTQLFLHLDINDWQSNYFGMECCMNILSAF